MLSHLYLTSFLPPENHVEACTNTISGAPKLISSTPHLYPELMPARKTVSTCLRRRGGHIWAPCSSSCLLCLFQRSETDSGGTLGMGNSQDRHLSLFRRSIKPLLTTHSHCICFLLRSTAGCLCSWALRILRRERGRLSNTS